MFRSRHPLHALHGLQGLHHVVGLAHGIHANAPWRRIRQRVRRNVQPSVVSLLLAGLAVFAFVKLMSEVSRPRRSRAMRLVLAVLLLAVGAIVMSFRRSARRYRW